METAEFEAKKREWEEAAEAKTAKNRAKRQKKKDRAKEKGKASEQGGSGRADSSKDGEAAEIPLKKRRLVNGQELLFKRPGEEDSDEEGDVGPMPTGGGGAGADVAHEQPAAPVDEGQKIVIHEDD